MVGILCGESERLGNPEMRKALVPQKRRRGKPRARLTPGRAIVQFQPFLRFLFHVRSITRLVFADSRRLDQTVLPARSNFPQALQLGVRLQFVRPGRQWMIDDYYRHMLAGSDLERRLR